MGSLIAQPTTKQAVFDLNRGRFNLVLLRKDMVLVSSATTECPEIALALVTKTHIAVAMRRMNLISIHDVLSHMDWHEI